MSVSWPHLGTAAGSVASCGSCLGPEAGMVLELATSDAASVSLNTWAAGGFLVGPR